MKLQFIPRLGINFWNSVGKKKVSSLDTFGLNLFIDSFPDGSPAVLAALAPALNLAILFSICSAIRRRRLGA